MRSDAGPRHSREFLSAYISGYVDGEGCFTVSIAPRARLVTGWEVRPSLSVSQNGDRAEVLHASLRQGEGIVCASGNGGITRSSDLHEWRNDLGTVSTRDPVKL